MQEIEEIRDRKEKRGAERRGKEGKRKERKEEKRRRWEEEGEERRKEKKGGGGGVIPPASSSRFDQQVAICTCQLVFPSMRFSSAKMFLSRREEMSDRGMDKPSLSPACQ